MLAMQCMESNIVVNDSNDDDNVMKAFGHHCVLLAAACMGIFSLHPEVET